MCPQLNFSSFPVRLRFGVLALLLTFLPFADRGADAQEKTAGKDVLIFANGDQLTGTLVRSVGETITFKSEMAGEISVPLGKIKELRTVSQFAVIRKDQPVPKVAAKTGQIAIEDGRLSVTRASDPVETVPAGQLAFLVDEPSYAKAVADKGSFLTGWNGSVTGGATLVRATQNGTTLTAGAALVRERPGVAFLPAHNRTLFNLSESYGKLTNPNPPAADSVVKTHIFHADAEYDHYFSPRLYALADTAFDHNFSQGLQLQQIYGVGLGYTVIQQPVQQLDVKAEIHYEKQAFINALGFGPTSNQNLIGATLGESYRRNLPLKLVFTESGTVDPAFNNTNAYSAQFQAALAIPAYKRLGFSVSAADSYLHNPPAGFNNNSVQFVTGLTYSLR